MRVVSPYSGVSYHRPNFGLWQKWFAWYPVRKYFYVEDAASFGIKPYRWIWLKMIYRRRVDYVYVNSVIWEYADLFEILQHD